LQLSVILLLNIGQYFAACVLNTRFLFSEGWLVPMGRWSFQKSSRKRCSHLSIKYAWFI